MDEQQITQFIETLRADAETCAESHLSAAARQLDTAADLIESLQAQVRELKSKQEA